MPFINGKFYMNPAYGLTVERARAAERQEPDDHWVTINRHHVLIHENQGERPR